MSAPYVLYAGALNALVVRNSKYFVFVDSSAINERHGFAERLEYGGEKEVRAQLHKIGGAWGFTEHSRAPAERTEQWPYIGDCVSCTRSNYEQLSGRCHVGPAQDRRSNIALTALAMCLCQTVGKSHANRARRDVNRAFGQALEDPAFAKSGVLDGFVVGQHC
jgi:hypothetical protein